LVCLESNTIVIMLKLLKPVLLTFFTTTAVKRLVVDLLRAICKQTTNTLDDRAVDMLEQQLFPKMN
jgi:hypothetical protein